MASASAPESAVPQPAEDSIDVRNARSRSQGFNWLAAVNPNSSISPKKTVTPTPSPPTVMQTTPMRTANSVGSWCFSPESVSAMGSPIPIETDDTEAPAASYTQQTQQPARGGRDSGGGSSPIPQLTPPQPFQTVQRATNAGGSGGGAGASGGTPFFYGTQTSGGSSQDGLPSPVAVADATSPFAPSIHNSYSSAIMQALSMSEGAAIAEAAQRGSPLSYAASATGSARASDALYQDGMRAKLAKQQWATVEKARQELLGAAKAHRECSFSPKLSPYAAKVERPAALRPENRAQAEILLRKQWLAMKKQESIERELEECTFRPLTLRAVNLEPAALQTNSAVFADLYDDAQEKQHFADHVRAQVVKEMEERVLYPQATAVAVPPEKIAEVVDRLFSKGAIVSGSGGGSEATPLAAPPEQQRKPELAPRTLQIVEAKDAAGERNPDVVDRLYTAHRGPSTQQLIERQLEVQRERTLEAVRRQQLADERQALSLEHNRALLSAKFRALSKRAAASRGQIYKPDRPQSVVGLARASLDTLTSEEAEELLYVLEKCSTECISEAEFIERILRSVRESPATARHALLRCPPPPTSQQEALRRARLAAPGHVALDPPPLPNVQREEPDPDALERAKARREQRMEAYREEKARRAAADPFNDDAQLEEDCTFQPAARRLIPYECRPDVQIEVRPTRAFELRRARALGQPVATRESTGKSASNAPEPTDRASLQPSRGADEPRSAVSASMSQDTARLLRFTDDDNAREDSGGRSTAVEDGAVRRTRPREHRSMRRATPTTYADIAEAREKQGHNSVTEQPSYASHSTAVGNRAPRDSGVMVRVTAPAAHTDPVSAAPSTSTVNARTISPHAPPSIAELAATGGEAALRQLGRDLLLRQLRDFQETRRQRAVK